MRNRLIDLWKKHKFLIICAAAYIIVFIASCFYNPWDTKIQIGFKTFVQKSYALESSLTSIRIENRFFDKVPLEFLGFGIADVAECVNGDLGISCGFIAYIAVLTDYLIKKHYESDENAGKFEVFISCYLCDNIMFYIISIFIKLFENIEDNPVYQFIVTAVDSINFENGIIPAIILIIAAVFVVIPLIIFAVPPMLITYVYFFAYVIAYRLCTDLIEIIDSKIMQNGGALFLELIMFILAVLIIIALNLLLSKVFEIIREWSIKPAKVYINLMKKFFQKFRSRR